MAVPLTTQILLADDHAVVRRGLRMVLEAQPDLTVVAEAGDGIEAVERGPARAGRPRGHRRRDAARAPASTPRASCSSHRPDMRILMLSMHDVEEFCFQALKAGASGYVLKTVADKELVDACRAAMRGEPFLSPPTIRTLMRAHLDDVESPLTAARARGRQADRRGAHDRRRSPSCCVISPRTVERHRENILAKLGMRDRVADHPLGDPARPHRGVARG